MASVPKKPGTYTVNGRRIRRLANGQVRFLPGKAKRAAPTRRRAPATKTAPKRRRKTPMNLKNSFETNAIMNGAITGAVAQLARNIPAVGRFAPAVGFAVGGMMAKDPSVRKTAHYLAGVSLGSSLLPSAVGGGSGGLL